LSEPGGATGPTTHRWPVRVYLEDTDALGIVYYVNYLRFAERARTEFLRALGTDHSAMIARDGLNFAVTRCEIDYLAPARLDDRLEVETSLLGIGGATLELLQRVRRGGEEITRVTVRLACTNRAGRPRRIPAALREVLEEFNPTKQ
jgi:acyl-CoA thioester hydrolase